MTSSSPPERSAHGDEAARPGRALVRGRLQVDFAVSPEGRTYIARQFASYPFHICRAQYHDADLPDLAMLYAQSCSGGLYRDDRLEIGVTAGEGARAHVTTQASTIVHGMPEGHASQEARIAAQRGSYLEYLPDPQILFPGARYSSRLALSVAEGATVLLGDAFLMHDPQGENRMFSSYLSEIEIADGNGRRLALDRIKLDAESKLRRVGIMGAYGAQATFLAVMPGSDSGPVLAALRAVVFDPPEATMGASQLPNAAGAIARILARDGAALKRMTQGCWGAVRTVLLGSPPAARRK